MIYMMMIKVIMVMMTKTMITLINDHSLHGQYNHLTIIMKMKITQII